MSFSNVELADGAFCLAYTSGGKQIPLHNGVFQVQFKANNSHNCLLYLDGVQFTTSPVFVGQDKTGSIRAAIPNDGQSHLIKVVDPGGFGTAGAQSQEISVRAICDGVVYQQVQSITENQATSEQYVDVVLSNTGRVSQSFTSRLLLDGHTVVSDITLAPGQTVYKTVTIPADNQLHALSGEVKIGSYFADDVVLWHSIQGNQPPPTPPDPSNNATQFIPGETVILQSSPLSTPLANDGSEWVLLEIAARGTQSWLPVGDDGGMVMPLEDGSWSATIFTNTQSYPVGSKWDVRARRFRDFRESDITTHSFDMVDGTVEEPPEDGHGDPIPTLVAPTITGPVNRSQAGGTWLRIYGTGTPGSRLEFRTQVVTAWGRGDYVPRDCTVGSSGRWETMVYAKKQAEPNNYKILGYQGRMLQNRMFSDWSNRLDVTWYHANR